VGSIPKMRGKLMYHSKNKGRGPNGLRGLSGPAGGADFEQFCTRKSRF